MKLLICTQAVDKNHPILGFFHGWVYEFSRHFDEVHVICLQKGEYAFPSHVHVYSLGKEEGENNLKYLYRFYKYFGYIFFRVRVDFVFFHMGVVYNILAFPFFVVRKFFKTKFYWWKTHGTLTIFGKIALACVDRVYTASVVSFPSTTKKKYVVGHAINIVDIPVHVEKNETVMLFVGRVTPVKKIELVLEVARLLQQRGITLRVRIVGALPDTIYEANIRQCIKDLDLEDIVTVVGPKKYFELQDEYTNATVLMNPSETGGIDKVVLEAMQYGVPAVALQKTYGELLNPFGLAVQAQDPKLYADSIERVIRDIEWRQSLEVGLRDEVVTHHALSTLSHRIFNV